MAVTDNRSTCRTSCRGGNSDLLLTPEEGEYGAFLNWLFHADATLTFPQTVKMRYEKLEVCAQSSTRSTPCCTEADRIPRILSASVCFCLAVLCADFDYLPIPLQPEKGLQQAGEDYGKWYIARLRLLDAAVRCVSCSKYLSRSHHIMQ